MIRRIAVLYFMILIYNISVAQKVKQDASKQNFSTPGFVRVIVNENASKTLKNTFRIQANRILPDGSFIVTKNLFQKFSNSSQSYRTATLENNLWKLSTHASQLNNTFKGTFYIQALKDIWLDSIKTEHLNLSINKKKIGLSFFIIAVGTLKEIQDVFLDNDEIFFIDVMNKAPKQELAVPGFDLSANKINLAHADYPSVAGEGRIVSIKEDFYDTTDIDLKNRFVYSPLASANVTNHANFMATIIAGGGNSVDYAKGAAWKAKVSSTSFAQVLPEADNYYQSQNIQVQNHSYGSDIDYNYGANAVAFDESTITNPGLLHVFSSGNSGNEVSSSGIYKNLPGYANLTGNFKMAKNLLTVGAVDSFGVVATLSSCGPAYDGRIKPELVAFQKNGTSEAAALVSGASVLLQEYYQSVYQQTMPAITAKAVLINSADDINIPGPDYKTGFGNMNVYQAMKTIESKHIFSGTVTKDSLASFNITIPANATKLKVTLVWNDSTASAGAPTALINDLDLDVEQAGQHWLPWVLSNFPSIDSLAKPAVRRRDSLNNVEQVVIDNPGAGNFKINIIPFNLPINHQSFTIAYSFDTANSFQWNRITKEDFAISGTNTLLQWTTNFQGKGNIEYSLADNNWKPLANNIDLNQNNFYWQVPDTVSRAQVRLNVGGNYFYSDTFFITQLPQPTTGYICGDSVFIYWQLIKGVEKYQLYKLGQNYLEPFAEVNGTTAIIKKAELQEPFIAVAPIIAGLPSIKSYAFDYLQQGAGCYINSFYAELQGSQAKLNLVLGSLFNVDSISFEKLQAGSYNVFEGIPVGTSLNYSTVNSNLFNGINTFRAKIVLKNGQVIYSNPEAVYYAAPGKYVLIPNPARSNNQLSLIGPVPDGETIILADITGRKIFQKQITSVVETISTSGIPAGMYIYQVIKNDKRIYAGKLVLVQ